MKITCNDIGIQTKLVPAKLGLPFICFIRDDETVVTNCEMSKSSSLSGPNAPTTEYAPMPHIFGNITLIDPQSTSISSTVTATTAVTGCGNMKAEPDFISDVEPYITTTPKTVATSSYNRNEMASKDLYIVYPDSSKPFSPELASYEIDDDVHLCHDIFAIDRCEDGTDCPFCVDDTYYMSDTDNECESIRYPQISCIVDPSHSENDSNSEMSDGDFDSDSTVIKLQTDANLKQSENKMSLSSAMQVAAGQNYVVTKFGAKLPILYEQMQPNINTASLVTKPEGQIVKVSPQKLKTLKCGDENKAVS